MITLDRIDCKILNLLQEDCRMSFTGLAKKVGLSVDSVRKRFKKLGYATIFSPKIQLRPHYFGYSDIVDVKVKLHNYTQKDIAEFTEYLKKHEAVTEVFSVSGDWDFTIVLMARSSLELGNISSGIRSRFSKIINTWSESLTTCCYKFEQYNMLKIMGYEK